MAIIRAIKISGTLARLARKKFGGRDGRYRIARSDLISLIGTKTLSDPTFNRIRARLHEKGYIAVDLGAQFAVIEEKPMKTYRKVPRRIIEELIEQLQNSAAMAKKKLARDDK